MIIEKMFFVGLSLHGGGRTQPSGAFFAIEGTNTYIMKDWSWCFRTALLTKNGFHNVRLINS